jgi:hypothetical protein
MGSIIKGIVLIMFFSCKLLISLHSLYKLLFCLLLYTACCLLCLSSAIYMLVFFNYAMKGCHVEIF